jgi:co-chaperonin GroES (HSP10)
MRYKPRAGMILIERDKRPLTSYGIIIPERSRLSKRSSSATIVAVGQGVDPRVQVGRRVVMSEHVGRAVRDGERELEAHYPMYIMCFLGAPAKLESEHPLKGVKLRDIALEDDMGIVEDEGTPGGW